MCGGTGRSWARGHGVGGLSPRVRGNHIAGCIAQQGRRSIPACAGEPADGFHRSDWRAVYPRVCGGTVLGKIASRHVQGLSPRVRGNRLPGCRASDTDGSIPACAGEPPVWGKPKAVAGVYPRVCGGTYQAMRLVRSTIGLSPRVRGNHAACLLVHAKLRSIPACAGEPWQGRYFRRVRWVYPRVCGGTLPAAPCPPPWTGLSPRVRGNRAGQRQR